MNSNKTLTQLKVAIVADWIIGGGAERVVLELHRMFPDAPIYTSYCSPTWRQRLDNKVVTSYLQFWPFPQLRKFIPGMRGRWFERLNLEEFDVVMSSSGAEAKGIRVNKPVHFSYIHAPTHYYWSRYQDYLANPGFGFADPLARAGLKALVNRRRKWDFAAAQRPRYLIANSSHTQSEILKYYQRKSDVIHPPVDTDFFMSQHELWHKKNEKCTRHGYVVVGRQTAYKRIDLAIQACTQLKLPLLVIGDGPQHKTLRALAGPTVFFKKDASREDIAHALCSAKGFIFPGLDDFGIAPVEALASGTPVLAYKAGGALDYVAPGKSGDFFDTQSVDCLVDALHRFDQKKYSSDDIKNIAKAFSNEKFDSKLITYLQEKL